jgi:hypothetical protein
MAIEKLQLSPRDHHRYTALANLGTALVHASFASAISGDASARVRMREGLAAIRASMAINPGAHFGRETWQAVAIEHLLACLDDPSLLERFDLVGDPLDDSAEDSRFGRSRRADFYNHTTSDSPADRRVIARRRLTRVGGDPAWAAAVHPSTPTPQAFDQPVLGMLGMWMLGGGPNPHFAIALGRIMERVGQRHIAWTAYERAREMIDRSWPDPDLRKRIEAWCGQRQQVIAEQEGGAGAADWQVSMRRQHRAELAWGESYQKDYADYERDRLAAGMARDDGHFYDTFFASHSPVATEPGREDQMYILHHSDDPIATMLLSAGFFALMSALFDKNSRRRAKTLR